MFIASLKTTEHVFGNSFFQKPDREKVTRADWNATGPPYNCLRYAEIDGIYPSKRARNMVKDIWSDTEVFFPSDHFPVNFRIKIKLSKEHGGEEDEANKWKGAEKPSEEQRDAFNDSFRKGWEEKTRSRNEERRALTEEQKEKETEKEKIGGKTRDLFESLKEAAEEHIQRRVKLDRTFNMSEETKGLWKERQEQKQLGNWDRAKGITRKIRRQMIKEKRENTKRHMEEELWYDIKKAKTGFMPNHTKLSNEKGEVITSDQRPDVLADYFEKVQWAIDEGREKEVRKERITSEEAVTETGEITIEELKRTIKKFKNNKSPGPDGIPVEFYKWMDEESLELFLYLLNWIWE